MSKLKVAFLGTPDFSLPALKVLTNHPGVKITHVITMPDRPAGRGQKYTSPPVALFAIENGLPLFQTEDLNHEENFLKHLDVDLFIVLAFAQFLKQFVLNIPKIGCFNIHTSLLPQYRGAAPIQYALLNGDSITGVSIQKMVKKMDAGDIVYSQKVNIFPEDNYEKLSHRLSLAAGEALNIFIEQILNNQVNYTPQNSSEVSFAPSFSKEDGHLQFQDKSDLEIINQIRAFTPWPSAFFFLNGKRVKVYWAQRVYNKTIKPGCLDLSGSGFLVGCKTGVLNLISLQLEGKKTCSGDELINGIKNKYDSFLIT